MPKVTVSMLGVVIGYYAPNIYISNVAAKRRALDAIRKADVLRWRDSWANRSGAFNRTIPILSVMMGYAEQLGIRPRGSNPSFQRRCARYII